MGLHEFLVSGRTYPYPDMLRRACNVLALHMRLPSYPRTQDGLLRLFEKPVGAWYPLTMPEVFSSEAGLMYDGSLSEEASQYLYDELMDGGLRETASTRGP